MSEVQAPVISLVKDEKVNLTKGNPGMNKLTAGGGWDINAGNSGSYDLDLLAFHLKNDPDTTKYPHGKWLGAKENLAYFNNLKIAGIQLDKDNLTGEGEGDDEKLFIDLAAIPADCDAVMLGVNIYQGKEKSQHFGMVKNAFMRIFDTEPPQKEHIRYDLSEDYSGKTAVLFGKLYRHDGEWKFMALGIGCNGNVQEIVDQFK